MAVLTVNAGSSSLKVSVFFESSNEPQYSAAVEDIGTQNAVFIVAGEQAQPARADDHGAAAELANDWVNQILQDGEAIETVSHRVVHGGERYFDATKINDELLAYLESIVALAPNHLPAAIAGITAWRNFFPQATQVACFDTGFFHDVPAVASTLPVPKKLRDKGLKRYGFHGLSYEYILKDFSQHEGTVAANGRVILAHLGSGASITACKDGRPVDMTMGLTPASGVMMSTRSGDIDPGVVDFLIDESGGSKEAIRHVLYQESGLFGVSESSADMYTLLQAQDTDPRAALAIEMFCYGIKKAIGAYAAVLGGVDSIIFTAGIGERSPEIRRRILENLAYLGVIVDEHRNTQQERLISADDSGVGVHVIHTREDVVLADTAKTFLEGIAS